MNKCRSMNTVFSLVVMGSFSQAIAVDLQFKFYDVVGFGCIEDGTIAYDVNDLGMVGGVSGTLPCPSQDGHPFVWTNGKLIDLVEVSEGDELHGASFVGRSGVTFAGSGATAYIVFLDNGVGKAMPTPPECFQNSYAQGMNRAGTMIGGSCILNPEDFHQRPAIYYTADGSTVVLDLLPSADPDADGYAEDVNDAGVVVGRNPHDNGTRSFVWEDGTITEVLNTVGGEFANTYCVSNTNIAGGSAETPNGWQAMTYNINTTEMFTHGDGTVVGINDRGVGVGNYIIDLSALHGMRYENGESQDLYKFFPDYMPDQIPNSINNYGWIAGYARCDLTFYGWLLVPIYDKGDYDGDGDVDLQDAGKFQECFAAEPFQGPEGGLHVGCSVFDFDDDVDLDLTDYAAFQKAFTGPTAPDMNPYGPG